MHEIFFAFTHKYLKQKYKKYMLIAKMYYNKT